MSSSSKGWLASKRKVLCGYCKTESRKDNLRRHIDNVHGKELETKFTIIEPERGIINFLKKQDEDSIETNNNIVNQQEGAETHYVDQIEQIDDSVEENLAEKRKQESSADDDMEGPEPKQSKIEADYLHKKMVEFEEKICKKIDERMDSIEKLVKDKSEKVKAPDSHENKHEQMVDMLMASMDLENVETSLDDLDFGKVV